MEQNLHHERKIKKEEKTGDYQFQEILWDG